MSAFGVRADIAMKKRYFRFWRFWPKEDDSVRNPITISWDASTIGLSRLWKNPPCNAWL